MNYAEFCNEFTTNVPKATCVGDRYYLVGDDLAGFTSGEQRKPYAKGLFLGMGRKFVPTLALLRLLSADSQRKAFVKDERAEWLFVCGRDIFHDGFTAERKEGFVLVQNQHDENLGLGKIVVGKEGLLLKNVLDRGNYLRHETITL